MGRHGMNNGALFLDRYLAGIVPADGTEVLRKMAAMGEAARAASAAKRKLTQGGRATAGRTGTGGY